MDEQPPTWVTWRTKAQQIETPSGQVAIYDLGDPNGQVITFLHGYPSSSLDLSPVLRHLGDGWRVLALDMPGFGASDKPADHAYSVHQATDAVEAMWAHLNVESTVIAAHDYSVSVAQELLARRGDGELSVTLDAVVWMNGGIYPDLHRPTPGQTALLDPEHGAAIAQSVTEETFVRGTAATWGTRVPLDEHAVREMYNSMDENGGIQMMHTLLHYVADRRTHADRWSNSLETSDVPMTFVWGDLDPVSGAHMIERVEERRPDARIVRMPDIAHWPPLECPEVVAAEIAAYASSGRDASDRHNDR